MYRGVDVSGQVPATARPRLSSVGKAVDQGEYRDDRRELRKGIWRAPRRTGSQGPDDAPPVARARVGVRSFGDRRRPAARRVRQLGRLAGVVAVGRGQRQRPPGRRHRRHPEGRHPAAAQDARPGHHLRPGRHRPRLPDRRVPDRPEQHQRPQAQARGELVAQRRRATSGPSSCARASSSTTARRSRPPTWSPASIASSTPRAARAPSPPSPASSSPGGTKAVDTTRCSSTSRSRSPTSRTW